MSTTLRGYHPRNAKNNNINNENQLPAQPKNNNKSTNNQSFPKPLNPPKRALGDITKLAQNNDNKAHNNRPININKVRRTAATKNVSSNSAAARRAKANALAAAARRSMSPMSTSTANSRQAPDRLARMAAAAAAFCGGRLDFESMAIDDTESFNLLQKKKDVVLYHTVQLPNNVIDIDENDRWDQLKNSVYAKDVHDNYYKMEKMFMPDPLYMKYQQDITPKMKSILYDWLVDVHQKFKSSPETLYTTNNIVDRFLEKEVVMRRKLQLVGITAMFIASKYHEIFAPELADFIYITDKAYTKEEILEMEARILNTLRFKLTTPSDLTFLERCLKAYRTETGTKYDEHKFTAQYLLELGLQNLKMLHYPPSLRAAAACSTAAKICGLPMVWSESMSFYSGNYSEADLLECQRDMKTILDHERGSNNKLTAVKRKFSVRQYGFVAQRVSEVIVDDAETVMDVDY